MRWSLLLFEPSILAQIGEKESYLRFFSYVKLDFEHFFEGVLFVGHGTAVDTDLYTPGCMVNVKTENSVRSAIETAIEKGVAHHYALVWADVAQQLIDYAHLLGIEVICV